MADQTDVQLVQQVAAGDRAALARLITNVESAVAHQRDSAIDALQDAGVADPKLAVGFTDAKPSRLDGLRLDWPDGAWLLVRPSNTEPIVRAIAEAPTLERARALCEQTAAIVVS